MANSIKKWLKEQNKLIKDLSVPELSSEYCFRDPIRPIRNNPQILYSPVDGIIIDCIHVENTTESVYTKYGDICLEHLTHGLVPERSYDVVTIFLTFYDAHIVRMPVNGVINRIDLPSYYVEDRPMLDFEKKLMDSKFNSIRMELLTDFAYNQRTLYSLKEPFREAEMYILLTADYDIDTILGFDKGINVRKKQNQRLASIRYGSMATCIVPSTWRAQLVCKENTHVEAGNDVLFYL